MFVTPRPAATAFRQLTTDGEELYKIHSYHILSSELSSEE